MKTTENTALDRIKETLATIEMDSLTRHWLEEDLSHLADADALQERIEELEQEVADLENETYDLESDKSSLEDDVYDLRQRVEELESTPREYKPGVN